VVSTVRASVARAITIAKLDLSQTAEAIAQQAAVETVQHACFGPAKQAAMTAARKAVEIVADDMAEKEMRKMVAKPFSTQGAGGG